MAKCFDFFSSGLGAEPIPEPEEPRLVKAIARLRQRNHQQASRSEFDQRMAEMHPFQAFRGDRHFEAIQLGPLEPFHHRLLVEAMLGGRSLSEGLASTLFAATEGNPFFTRELVRSLAESGGIAEDETGRYALSSATGITPDALPKTIQQVVERQIEGLAGDLREVLATAAVLGVPMPALPG